MKGRNRTDPTADLTEEVGFGQALAQRNRGAVGHEERMGKSWGAEESQVRKAE